VSDASLLRLPAREAVTRLCLQLLAAARARELGLDAPGASDALHDFRVALRRLRSALRSWGDRLGKAAHPRERRRLARIQAATGAGRDAEVALEWLERQRGRCGPEHRAGFEWLVRRFSQQVEGTRAQLDGELRAGFRESAERLEKRLLRPAEGDPGPPFARALAEAAQHATATLVERLARIRSAQDVSQMHAARIACKRLRYLVEPEADACDAAKALVDACKALQTLLGDLNDTANLAKMLEAALTDSAAERAARVGELLRAGYTDRARREAWFTEWPGLIELAQVLSAERADRFSELQREVLEPGAEPFHSRSRALGAELLVLGEGQAEIERKFLLERLPCLEQLPAEVVSIEQGWLDRASACERLRALSDGVQTRYYRTLKLGSGIERTEHEQEIPAETFARLWPATEGCRLRKRRHRVRDGELIFEIDEFMDRELALAEVELPRADAALELPEWLSTCVEREVTGEPQYTGSALGR
jgi:CHAD domain-containing protein/CYTH domain-containing protein